jgi:prepilin-type processing-associated H-X9-DG protein/prepilin-type N-terminal cleavage/methylation domain-containing protein
VRKPSDIRSYWHDSYIHVSFNSSAFTLLELLIVITIIGILMVLLLPVLSIAKGKARSTSCLDNLSQLQICCHLYGCDNGDTFPPNDSIAISDGSSNGTTIASGLSWCPDHPLTDTNTVNLERGVLFSYNRSTAIYHCPEDNATVQTMSGQPLTQLRNRSYNMSQSVNGYSEYLDNLDSHQEYSHIPAVKKLTQVRLPSPSGFFVFIDELANTELDSSFGMPPKESPYFQQWQNCWFDMPADRHNQGGNLSFADGHVEHWQWKVPKVFTADGQAVSDAEMPDYVRLQNAMLQPAVN